MTPPRYVGGKIQLVKDWFWFKLIIKGNIKHKTFKMNKRKYMKSEKHLRKEGMRAVLTKARFLRLKNKYG